ncbi:aminotransferase class I/II-fold pyridoxal phosphate-dependent enzyme [Streptomyces sp. NPDC056831]|uniref:aminotransferase class I/II-fold pyridoxal phosphate-dependent enzyme n=1 Tax=Streptomyces sp. NPDC056831 TaxID=3345954 RepID=UPI0036CAC976
MSIETSRPLGNLSAGPVAVRKTADARINLSSNELAHPAAVQVLRDAWLQVLPEQARCYPRNAEDIQAIGDHFGLAGEAFQLTPGSDVALRLIVARARSLFPDGPTLLLQSPNYPAWEEAAEREGIPVQRVGPVGADADARTERFIAAARSAPPGLMAISVPNGPMGWGTTQEQLDAVVGAAERGGHLLVVDACYQAFAGPLRASLARRGHHVAVVQSLSKSHGLAGARISLLATSPTRLRVLGSASLEQAVGGPSLALARAVLRRESALRPVWEEIMLTRERARQQVRGIGLEPLPSAANFLTVKVGPRAARVASELSRSGYRVREFHRIDQQLDDCLRFTVTSADECGAFLSALERAVKEVAA